MGASIGIGQTLFHYVFVWEWQTLFFFLFHFSLIHVLFLLFVSDKSLEPDRSVSVDKCKVSIRVAVFQPFFFLSYALIHILELLRFSSS